MSIPEERYVDIARPGSSTGGVPAEIRELQRRLDAHIGKGGNAHAIATPEEAGFMSQSDKEKFDTVQRGATQNQTDEYLLNLANATGELPIDRVDGLQEEIDRISGDSAAQLREDLANDVEGNLGAHLVAFPAPEGESWNVADLANPDIGAAMVAFRSDSVGEVLEGMRLDPGITDVFVVYGQSNAKGSAQNTLGREPITDKARYWSAENQDIRQLIYDMDYTASFTALKSSGHAWGAFANRYVQLTGRRVVIVPSAVGGTSMAQLAKGNDTTNIYSDMVAEFGKAMAALSAEGVTVGSINCLFHQGETDQADGVTYDEYVALMGALFDNMVSDLGIQHFYVALVGNPQSRPEVSWHRIRTAQQFVADERADTTIAYSNFANHLQSNGLLRSDGVHATQHGYNAMGEAMARHIAAHKQLSLTRDEGYLSDAAAVDVVNSARVRKVSCAIRLTSAGAELLTRDNNGRHISSMVDAVTLSSGEIFVRCNALRSHKVFGMQVSVVDENLPGSMVDASVISTLVDTNKIGFRIRLATGHPFIVDTTSGSGAITQDPFGTPLRYHTAASISVSGGAGFWSLSHNSASYSPMFSMVKTLGSPALVSGGLQATVVSGSEFRLPVDAGLIACSIPSHTIRPNALPTGCSLLVSLDALVASPRV